MIGVITMAKFEGRPQLGSSMIRGEWLVNNSNNFEIYKIGKKYDAYIYQKSYWVEHAKLVNDAPKILDICDPDWYNWRHRVIEMLQYVDVITVPTETMMYAIKRFTDKPVIVISDSLDCTVPEFNNERKIKEIKNVVWFGYSNNFKMLDACVKSIEKLGLSLTVISNTSYKVPAGVNLEVNNILYKQENAYQEIQKCDVCINPKSDFGKYKFKSDNKTIVAQALGVPVAFNELDLKRIMSMDLDNLQKEVDITRENVKSIFNINNAIEQYENIINEVNSSVYSK